LEVTMSGFTTVMPFDGAYAVVFSPDQPTEPGAAAIMPTTVLLTRDGPLALHHQAEKALLEQEGEEACAGFETAATLRGRDEVWFPSWHFPEVLAAAREMWGLAPHELPSYALQSVIVVRDSVVLDVRGEAATERSGEIGPAATVETEGEPCP
jgi:hypothetical protein